MSSETVSPAAAPSFLATHASDHLVGYIDSVLEAFQSGVGIRDAAAEPITIDIARRLIWSEVRRTIRNLVGDVGNGVECATLAQQLWLRLDAADSSAILKAIQLVPAQYQWTLRCAGPRAAGHVAVTYAIASPVDSVAAAQVIIDTLTIGGGVGVRDWTLGSYPY